MKRFVCKVSVLTLCVIFIISGFNQVYIYRSEYDPYNTRKYKQMPDRIQISNVGSSHGEYGFCYKEYEKTYGCFNFGLSSQSLSYDYRVIKDYEEHFEEDGIMFIVVSYWSFYGNDETEDENFQAKNKRYYSILSARNIKYYEWQKRIYYKYFPILGAGSNLIPTLMQSNSSNMEVNWNRSAAEVEKSVLEEDAESAVKRHITDRKEIVNEKEINALYDIIDFCKDRGIKPILVTTPYTDVYNEKVPVEFLKSFHEIVETVQEECGVEYYDYADDIRFCKNYDLFLNADHLNKKGALLFTKILVEDQKEFVEKGNVKNED